MPHQQQPQFPYQSIDSSSGQSLTRENLENMQSLLLELIAKPAAGEQRGTCKGRTSGAQTASIPAAAAAAVLARTGRAQCNQRLLARTYQDAYRRSVSGLSSSIKLKLEPPISSSPL